MLSLDVTKKCLVAEGWSPVFATKQVCLPSISNVFAYIKQFSPALVFHNDIEIEYAIQIFSLDMIIADPGCIRPGSI